MKLKPLLVVNPRAAGTRTGQRWTDTSTAVRDAIGDFDSAFTEYCGHAVELARQAVLNGRELVVAVGGDGTLSDVVNGVLLASWPDGRPIAMGSAGAAADSTDVQTASADGLVVSAPDTAAVGYIAQGTGGDFRRSLGHRDSLPEYLARLGGGSERRIDVGLLDHAGSDGSQRRRYFLNIVSAGMGGLVDEYVVAAPRWIGGHLAYYVATLRALAAVPLAHLRCTVTLNGNTYEREIDSRVVAVCNGAYFGSGMNVAPGASVSDGQLEVVNIGTRTRFELLVKSPSVYRGAHLSFEAVQHFSCQRIAIALDDAGVSPDRFPLDVDGDPCGRLPLAIEVLPGALRFLG
jgi:diacylglycerol kinase family enzyme